MEVSVTDDLNGAAPDVSMVSLNPPPPLSTLKGIEGIDKSFTPGPLSKDVMRFEVSEFFLCCLYRYPA